MRDRMENEYSYPFLWLDELVEVTLNPDYTDQISLTSEALEAIKDRLPGELSRISARLKDQTFCLFCDDQIKVVTRQYQQAIRLLTDQAQINLACYSTNCQLYETGQLLLGGLNKLAESVDQRYRSYLPEGLKDNAEKDPSFKVLCQLSVDQIAIILKAADDVKLVVARSFSLVLRSIVPFLSSQRLSNFSWKSARSSTYKMEGSDRDTVIQALEVLITRIKEY